MKKILILNLLILSLLVLPACNNQPAETKLTKQLVLENSTVEKLRENVYLNMQRGGASAVTFAAAYNGEIIFVEQFGVLSRAAHELPDNNTVNRIGSISKIFTAAAIMKLVEEGKVHLDDPVIDYLADFKMEDIRYREITIRMLLDHSSGIPGTNFIKAFGYEYNPDYGWETLEALSGEYLKHDPGYLSVYCNDGFILAELIVEQVSGMSYKEFIDHHFAGPLYLENLFFPEDDYSLFKIPYYYDNLKPGKYPQEYVSALGSGGILGSAGDLALFAGVFDADNKILTQESIDEIFKPVRNFHLGNDPYMLFGLGFDDVDVYPFSRLGIKAVTKNGGTDQSNSQLLYLPEHKLSVAIISQGVTDNLLKIIIDFTVDLLVDNDLIDGFERSITMPSAIITTPEEYAIYEGIYASHSSLYKVDLEEDGMVLFAYNRDSGAWVPLYGRAPYRENGYFYTDYSPNAEDYGLWLRFEENASEKYLMMAVSLSSYTQEIPIAHMLLPAAPASEIWEERSGKWLIRNDSYYSYAYGSDLSYSSINDLTFVNDLPGYVSFAGMPFLIRDDSQADMCLSVPVTASMDIGTVKIINIDEEEYLQFYNALFSKAEDVLLLKGEQTIRLDSNLNQWRKIEGFGRVSFTSPSGDQWRIIAFDHDHHMIYDSCVDKDNNMFFANGGLIMIAGVEGLEFTLRDE